MGRHGAPMGPMGAPMGAPMGPPWAPCGQPACRPAGNPAFIFRSVISPKQRPKIWQRISPTVCQNASWTHLVVFSRRFYIGRPKGELTIFHQTPISSTDTIDFCSTGHFQVGAKSTFFRSVISYCLDKGGPSPHFCTGFGTPPPVWTKGSYPQNPFVRPEVAI